MYRATIICRTSQMSHTGTFDECEAWVSYHRWLGIVVSSKIEPTE